ncbi:MAG TPA: M15 family peptidase [Candidatus Paceibacterota bacterium]|nr:M15 family peptidase [Candidatus Paceibacterota bacterium]
MERLDSCDARLQRLCFEVIKHYDFSVLEGHRTLARQQELFNSEPPLTTLDGVNKKSMHQPYPSLAVDLMPWPENVNGRNIWEDKFRWHYFARVVIGTALQMSIKIRWGGDWDGDWSNADQKFHDLPHFELVD